VSVDFTVVALALWVLVVVRNVVAFSVDVLKAKAGVTEE
jgi:hypothetical protein